MKLIRGHGKFANRLIVSLCDYSGRWPQPFADLGYTVLLFDLKHGDDVVDHVRTIADIRTVLWGMSLDSGYEEQVYGIMAAPPCTHFTVSGAQYWATKDADGRTAENLKIVDACYLIEAHFPARKFFVLENPVGRLPKLRPLMGKPKLYFQPCDYAGWLEDPKEEAYTKKTGLWGEFTDFRALAKPVEPIFITDKVRGKKYSIIHWYTGGGSEKTKEERSMTPLGFARAFCAANHKE